MRILLVEDDTSLSRAVSTILQKNNYTVDWVGNGLDAVEYVKADIYDAVIMDIMMPKMDGVTALKHIRNDGNDVPVLLLTAKTEIEDKVTGLDMGANDYLTKPFDSRELLARLRVITRGTKQKDYELKLGNMTLNTNTCELSTMAGSYTLTNKEYQMLEMFMKNEGKIISAEQFMEHIWSMDSDSDITTVWTYISYIRRKLESLQADYSIATKRNIGYYLTKRK